MLRRHHLHHHSTRTAYSILHRAATWRAPRLSTARRDRRRVALLFADARRAPRGDALPLRGRERARDPPEWDWPPWLLSISVAAAVGGLGVSIVVGHRLVGLEVQNQKVEAQFRTKDQAGAARGKAAKARSTLFDILGSENIKEESASRSSLRAPGCRDLTRPSSGRMLLAAAARRRPWLSSSLRPARGQQTPGLAFEAPLAGPRQAGLQAQ